MCFWQYVYERENCYSVDQILQAGHSLALLDKVQSDNNGPEISLRTRPLFRRHQSQGIEHWLKVTWGIKTAHEICMTGTQAARRAQCIMCDPSIIVRK